MTTKSPCLRCDHHLAGGSKFEERCLYCFDRLDYMGLPKTGLSVSISQPRERNGLVRPETASVSYPRKPRAKESVKRKKRTRITPELHDEIRRLRGAPNYLPYPEIAKRLGIAKAAACKHAKDVPCIEHRNNNALSKNKVEEVLKLRKIGMLRKDIAKEVEINVNTVGSILRRERKGRLNLER